tara:strand:- start:1410 stop:1598 length:189 start_codon:yes stop_codon:yes gene_type:complete
MKGWLNTTEAANYLGVSKRSLMSALELRKRNLKNLELILKCYGNRTLIKISSLDKIETIETK